jgi:hypothetical protein
LNAQLKNILSKQGQQNARLQFRAVHSLDFMASRLHVFRDVHLFVTSV